MSRVEDDRQAQRTAERIVQEKRLQESKTKQKQEGASAFSKLVQPQQQPAQQARAQQPQQPQQNLGKSVLARLTQESQTSKKQDENVRQSSTSEGQRTSEGRQTDSALSTLLGDSRHVDQEVSDTRTESRTEDSRSSNEALDERKGAEGGAHAGRGKGALKTDADGGGKGGGGDKKDGNSEMAAGFRFNPALMAPVPVAKPKPNTGSERLRQIANEIAQKIVERVRVGTNSAGNAEFQIDLRNDVLSGLSIKLSAKNGKISAVFSGRDRDVLKMLEEQKETLATALKGRGLTLEDLRIEAKT
jgi:hypothetical protein